MAPSLFTSHKDERRGKGIERSKWGWGLEGRGGMRAGSRGEGVVQGQRFGGKGWGRRGHSSGAGGAPTFRALPSPLLGVLAHGERRLTPRFPLQEFPLLLECSSRKWRLTFPPHLGLRSTLYNTLRPKHTQQCLRVLLQPFPCLSLSMGFVNPVTHGQSSLCSLYLVSLVSRVTGETHFLYDGTVPYAS